MVILMIISEQVYQSQQMGTALLQVLPDVIPAQYMYINGMEQAGKRRR